MQRSTKNAKEYAVRQLFLYFCAIALSACAMPGPGTEACGAAGDRFVAAVRSGTSTDTLVERVSLEARDEIARRQAPLKIDQKKVKASVERGVQIWTDTGSPEKVKQYFVEQCTGMLIHWC